MGIGLEEFGAGSFKLDGLPPFLQVDEPLTLVREIIDALQSASAGASRMRSGRGHDRQDRVPPRGESE